MVSLLLFKLVLNKCCLRLQFESAARELYRDEKALQLLQKFRSNSSKMVANLALILQVESLLLITVS